MVCLHGSSCHPRKTQRSMDRPPKSFPVLAPQTLLQWWGEPGSQIWIGPVALPKQHSQGTLGETWIHVFQMHLGFPDSAAEEVWPGDPCGGLDPCLHRRSGLPASPWRQRGQGSPVEAWIMPPWEIWDSLPLPHQGSEARQVLWRHGQVTLEETWTQKRGLKPQMSSSITRLKAKLIYVQKALELSFTSRLLKSMLQGKQSSRKLGIGCEDFASFFAEKVLSVYHDLPVTVNTIAELKWSKTGPL